MKQFLTCTMLLFNSEYFSIAVPFGAVLDQTCFSTSSNAKMKYYFITLLNYHKIYKSTEFTVIGRPHLLYCSLKSSTPHDVHNVVFGSLYNTSLILLSVYYHNLSTFINL